MPDVAIVSDFSHAKPKGHPISKSGLAFVCRTLLFMGSWAENAGAAGNWPLHIVCIGEPPTIIRKLADKHGFILHISKPPPEARISPVANKFNAWDIDYRTQHLLLLDADTVILKSPQLIAEMTGVIGVSPVFVNCCPLEKWREIYPGLGRKLPVRRMLSTYGQIGMAGSKHRYPNNEPIPPLYNGGALLVPWDLDFGNHWRRNFHVMHDTFGKRSDEWQRITSSDQPSLAVTVEEFRSRNQRIRMLPHGVNVWIPHVSGGEVSCEETIIYHAANIFRNYNIDADMALECKKMINGTAEREVELRAIYRKLADLTMRHVKPYLGQL